MYLISCKHYSRCLKLLIVLAFLDTILLLCTYKRESDQNEQIMRDGDKSVERSSIIVIILTPLH